MRSIRRLTTVPLATALAAAVLASCGDDEPRSGTTATATTASTPPEPTEPATSTGTTATTDTTVAASLAEGASAICQRYRADAGALAPRDQDPIAYERDLAAIEARTITALRALPASEADRATLDAYVDAQATAFGAIASLRTSGESGEGDGPAAATADAARAEAQRHAFALGFDSCTQV